MADLVACVSTGKGTWLQVAGLIKRQEWDNIFLITNQFGKENFKPEKKANMILKSSQAEQAHGSGSITKIQQPEKR